MVARETSVSLASPRLDVGVRNQLHEVRLGERVIFMYKLSIYEGL